MPTENTKKRSGTKFHSDPTNNRTRKNSYANVLKIDKKFNKLNTEHKNFNIYMKTMIFVCHKMKIGSIEATLSASEERALNKIALHLEQQYIEAGIPFDIEQFKSLFRRSAKSLKDSGIFKKDRLSGGNPRDSDSNESAANQLVVYDEMPLGVNETKQNSIIRWFKNVFSLKWNVEKLDIVGLLALFLGIFQLFCAWKSLSSLALSLTGASSGEISAGFANFISNEISVSGLFSIFTFAFVGNAFNRVFSNELDFLQSSLISQITNVSGVVSSSIQTTCFSHLAEQSAWAKLADMMVSGNLEAQLECINEVTKIEGNRAFANISADFQLKNAKFKKDSHLVLNQAWTGIFYIRGSLGWFSYRLGYHGLAKMLYNMGNDMKKIKPSNRTRIAKPGQISEVNSSSSSRMREIENQPSGGGAAVVNSAESNQLVKSYLGQVRRHLSDISNAEEEPF